MHTHRQKRHRRTDQGGFSLIELLVVIAIIALLSSILMANLTVSKQRAEDARILAQRQQIQLQLELFYNEHGGYPNPTPGVKSTTCISNNECVLAGVSGVLNKLSVAGWSFGYTTTPLINGTKGFVYMSCGSPEPYCPAGGITSTSSNSYLLFSSHQFGEARQQTIGVWENPASRPPVTVSP